MLRLARGPWRQLVTLSTVSGAPPQSALATSPCSKWGVLCGVSVPLLTTVALCEGAREASTGSQSAVQRSILDRILQDERLVKWAAVSKSLQACLQHVGPWTLGDLAFGLRAVAEKHAEEGAEDALTGSAVTNRVSVERLLEDLWIAEAVHQGDADTMAGMCALERRNIVKFDGEADHFQTAFAIALWPERKEVVLAMRGTTSLADALTDLSGHLEPFGGGAAAKDAGEAAESPGDEKSSGGVKSSSSQEQPAELAHHGMLKAAQSLLAEQGDELARLLQKNPGYRLKIVGHSLGAGTASLVAMLVHNNEQVSRKLGNPEVVCVAFATPPVVTQELAIGCGDYVTTVVYQHDVIPRASLAGFEALRQEMLSTDWEQNLTAEFKSNRAFQLALKARTSLDRALDDVIEEGIKKRSAAAMRAIASAYAGAKGAVMTRLGRTTAEAEDVGAGVGAGIERAREVAAGERSTTQLPGDAEGAGDTAPGAEDDLKQKGAQEDGQSMQNIPELFAPGRLLYIRRKSDDGPFELLRAEPPEQRFRRIVLNEHMVDHHRCTNYIVAVEGVLEACKSR